MKPCKFCNENVNTSLLENDQQIQKEFITRLLCQFLNEFSKGRKVGWQWNFPLGNYPPSYVRKRVHGVFLTNPSINPLKCVKVANC